MKFFIEYTGNSEQRTLIYRDDEFSFDMEPLICEIDFDIVINTLTLAVIDDKVIQLSGFCGLNKKMKDNYEVPQSQKGELKIMQPEKYMNAPGSYRIKKEDMPVYVNIQTGWVCIGDPEKQGVSVEFINNCVAVINVNNELVSLWLKPIFSSNLW